MKSVIALWLVAALVAGCMPAATTIYRPEAPGGTLRETMCRYNSGPGIWNAIEFEREGSVIRFLASRNTDSNLSLNVTITLPENTIANITRPTILLTSKELDAPLEMRSDSYSWYDGSKKISAPMNNPLIGGSFAGRWKKIHKSYYFEFVSPNKTLENFEIAPPAIAINGKNIELPNIGFHWETTFFIATINC